MIKFLIAARRKREDTQERYFYEWGIINVALLLSTPAVMDLFRRYAQHYSVSGISNDMLNHPLSEMEWDSLTDHWVLNDADLLTSVTHPQYLARLKPHQFRDSAVTIQIAESAVIYDSHSSATSGVKLIHFLKRRADVSQGIFNRVFQNQHANVVTDVVQSTGIVRKYVQNSPHAIGAAMFAGTPFQGGGVNTYAGMEEYWFDSVEHLARLRRDTNMYEAIRRSENDFVDPEGSFSMVTTERVIFDYTLGERSSPRAAILNPCSLEAAVFRQGLRGWNHPSVPGSA